MARKLGLLSVLPLDGAVDWEVEEGGGVQAKELRPQRAPGSIHSSV